MEMTLHYQSDNCVAEHASKGTKNSKHSQDVTPIRLKGQCLADSCWSQWPVSAPTSLTPITPEP